jgi:hypothetical protein
MSLLDDPETAHESRIERLVEEFSHLPRDDVLGAYNLERQELEKTATIKDYIAQFAYQAARTRLKNGSYSL